MPSAVRSGNAPYRPNNPIRSNSITLFEYFPQGFDESLVIFHPANGHSGTSRIAPCLSLTDDDPFPQKSLEDFIRVPFEVNENKVRLARHIEQSHLIQLFIEIPLP